MPREYIPTEDHLDAKIGRQKKRQMPESFSGNSEVQSINQAITILNSLSEDAFMRRPIATEKLDHAIAYLKAARDQSTAEHNE